MRLVHCRATLVIFFIYSLLYTHFLSATPPTNPLTSHSWQDPSNIERKKPHLIKDHPISENIDQVLNDFFGTDFLKFAGYYQDASCIGCYRPNQELNPLVKITFVNGMFNYKEDIGETLTEFSNSHGGNTIYYVFHSSKGWTDDLIHSTLAKWGVISPVAHMIAQLWQSLIQEMGGTSSGGIIIHYAHSIGATNTLLARQLLSPEELTMIHVITLGSPTLIQENTGFGSVVNYASTQDFVTLLDPWNYLRGWLFKNSNVYWLRSSWDAFPFDHVTNCTPYKNIIRQLGVDFVSTYK